MIAVLLALASTLLSASADEPPVIAGVVTDGAGAPVAGADITVTSPDGRDIAGTTSGPEGTFTVSVPPGEYRVLARAESHVMRWFGGGEDRDSGSIITAESGISDASLSLERGAQLSGHVTIGGAPVPGGFGFRVSAQQQSYPLLGAGTSGWTSTTESSGAFEIVAETERPVLLLLEIYRESDGIESAIRYWYGAAYRTQEATPVHAGAGSTLSGLDIDFPGFATVTGIIRNHYGAPVNASVQAYVRPAGGHLVPVADAQATLNGYRLVVPADAVLARGKWWHGEGSWWTYHGDTTDDLAAQWLDLKNEEVRTGIDVRIQGGARVSGILVDRNGNGVENATVEVTRGSTVVSAATTGIDGRFVVEGVGATSVGNFLDLRVSGDGIVPTSRSFGPSHSGYTDVGLVGATYRPDRVLSPSAAPTIKGVASPGAVLTVDRGTWNVEPADRRFSWYCDGQPAALRGASVTLSAEHASCKITVLETALRPGYESGVATSAGVHVRRLRALTRPTLVGKPVVGGALRAVVPEFNLDPDKVTYRWLRDGRYLRFKQRTFAVRRVDRGHRLAVQVVGHLNGYNARSTSVRVTVRR